MDPSRNPDGSFRTREEYERAMDELSNPRPVVRGISRSSPSSHMDLAGRHSHHASEDELRRIEEMQRPPSRSRSPQGRSGMMSTTMARYRAREAAFERARQEQLAFYAMLEQRYGAVPGDDHSYLVAMERYDYDLEKEHKKRAKAAAGTVVAFQSEAEMEAMIRGLDEEVRERLRRATAANQRASSHWREYEREKTRKEEAELAEIERLRQEAERLRREYEARQEHERRRREEEYRQFQERERQRRQYEQEQERRYQEQERRQREQEWNQRQQQHQQHHGRAHAARPRSPSPRRDAPESPKSALARRYPAPETRPAAFAILGLPASASKTEIKKAYRHGAMVLHPDKNPGNQDEATIRFQQLQQAYNLLNPQGGGRKRHIRLRHSKSRKMHKTHKTHRRGKTNRRRRHHHHHRNQTRHRK
jgi:hypothetical protein